MPVATNCSDPTACAVFEISKAKTFAIPALGSPHHVFLASMAAYVGIDPRKDINWVTHPVADSTRLLVDKKIDARHGLPADFSGAPDKKDRACSRQQRSRPSLVAIFLLRDG